MLLKPMSYNQMYDFLIENHKEAKNLYITHDYTARQLAQKYNIVYNRNFQKACLRVLGEKGLGLGGSRKGAGVKVVKEVKRRKETIVVSLADDCIGILKKKVGTNSAYIERAIRYYNMVANLEIED